MTNNHYSPLPELQDQKALCNFIAAFVQLILGSSDMEHLYYVRGPAFVQQDVGDCVYCVCRALKMMYC